MRQGPLKADDSYFRNSNFSPATTTFQSQDWSEFRIPFFFAPNQGKQNTKPGL